jgi:HSP20 family protein
MFNTKTLVKSPLFELDQFDLLWKDFFNTESFFADITTRVSHPTDIYETEKGITLEVAAVGLNKEDININVDGDILRITYSKAQETQEKPFVYKGIKRGSFDVAWRISNKFDISKLEAKLEKGLLIIEIPLTENKNTKRKIDIK